MKAINITDINIKDFSASHINNKWTISVVYSLVADDGTELSAKRIQMTEFTTNQKAYLTNILNVLITKIKAKENI